MATELSEQEIQINELESRVDRLRALYDQYFMGIEKLQPLVVMKDVERRVQLLRKTQIRNTALRFRFNMTVQKLSTYQSHWQRVCRQIEEGTYKRDVRRAKERFGDGARQGKKKAKEIEVEVDLNELNVTELDMDDLLDDDEVDTQTLQKAAPVSATSAAVAAQAHAASLQQAEAEAALDFPDQQQFQSFRRFDASSSSSGFGLDDPDEGMPIRPRAPIEERPSRSMLPGETSKRPGTLRKIGAPVGAAPPKGLIPPGGLPGPEAPAPAGVRKSSRPPRISAKRRSVPPDVLPDADVRGGPVPPARPPLRVEAAPAPGERITRRSKPPPAPAPSPAVAATLGAPARSAGTAPQPSPASPAASPGPMRPIPMRPVPRARVEGELSDERVRQLYTQYIDAKRSRQESTASLTYDSLAQSLRDSSAKLRQKHNGKNVDFEVTVKDGKTILKPVVK